MKPDVLTAPFKQLVERRLWPLAVLLVAALAAVPILLAKEEEAPAPPAAVAAADAQGPTQPIVSETDEAAHDNVRKVLGSPKNPFRPAVAAKKGRPAKTAAPQVASGGGATVDTKASEPAGGGSSPSTGGSSAPAPTAPTAPTAPATPQVPAKTYELHSLIVRFGSTDGDLALRSLKRLKGLPSGAPKLVYLGLRQDRKTAVFLVDAAAKVQGDGRCEPTPADCQRLHMRAGDTVFIDVADKQFELDVVKVIAKKTTRASEAVAARTSVAKGGRAILRKHLGKVGRYRYSTREGALKVLPQK